MTRPTPLKKGDTVALLAPGGPCDGALLDAAVKAVEAMYFTVDVMPSCRARHDYLAGTDAERAEDVHRAFANPRISGIFCLRGGYGAARLLPLLDFGLIAANPKVFAGYSDITALHTAFNQRCGFVTYHAPMAASEFACGADAFTTCAFRRMLFADDGWAADGPRDGGRARVYPQPYARLYPLENPPGVPMQTLVRGCAEGPLTGGNLSLLAASLGTPDEVDTRGKILFMEEINEPPYKIDRLFLQLKQAGKFRDAHALLLGYFLPEGLRALRPAVHELIVPENKPTLAGFACGHVLPTHTLPLGADMRLNADNGEVFIRDG